MRGRPRLVFEAREDASESLESAEEPFDLIALFIEGAAIGPGLDAIGLGRNERDHAQAEYKLARFIALVGATHHIGKPSGIGSREHSKRPLAQKRFDAVGKRDPGLPAWHGRPVP